MVQTIAAHTFAEKLKGGAVDCVVDVRTLAEFRTVRLSDACAHIPLDEIDADKVRSVIKDPSKPFYLLCAAGKRARMAAEKLEAAGLTQGIVVEGGIDACMSCGTCVQRGKALSLERQVRIAAGALVLTGIALDSAGFPLGTFLAGFVGAGLVFAGISGWCGMALLLAKAPWNK